MRGPRDVNAEVSDGAVAGLLFVAGAGADVVSGEATGVSFGEAGWLARREAPRLAADL